MKPVLIIAAALAVLVGFVALLNLPKQLERQASTERHRQMMEQAMSEHRCNLSIIANRGNAEIRELCDQIKELNRLPANR